MSIDKKTQQIISGILSEVIDGESVKIYQEVATKGMSATKIRNLELKSNQDKLEEHSPFHRLTKDIQVSNDHKLKDFHSAIMKNLREKRQVEVPSKKLEALLSHNSVFKNLGTVVVSLVGEKRLSFTEEQVEKASYFSKKAKNTELLKTYLLLNNEKMETSSLQVLSKGLQNVENPQKNKFIPKELIQSTGMIQIGLALNAMATNPVERNRGEIRRNKEIRIKRLSQAGSHSTEFITSCKQLARDWEEKNLEVLLSYVNKQKEQHKKEDDLINKVSKIYSEKPLEKNKNNQINRRAKP